MTEPKSAVRERRRARETVEEPPAYAHAIVDTVREPLVVLGRDLRVKWANRSFYAAFAVSPEETENRLIYDLGNRQWDIPKLRELLEKILPQKSDLQDFEVEHKFPNLGRKTMLLNARTLRLEDTGGELILLAIEDITRRRRAEEELTRHRDHLEELVHERSEELRKANVQLTGEATERKRAEEELRQRVAELDAFAYSVSHDLQEPLRSITAFSQFLLEDWGDRLDEQGRESLVRLANSSARMKRQIEDLLALSRLSRHSGPATRVEVGQVVGEILDGIRPTIDAKGATVEVEDRLPHVRADALRIRKVFANLIGNALKFNESECALVKVGVRDVEGDMATFYVQDNGIGIDPQYHEQIFGVFERLHHREDYEGTGAGLAIVKQVVETLGGRVSVESEVGAGATFLFTLPLWMEGAASVEPNAA